jgi:hypothetical protein
LRKPEQKFWDLLKNNNVLPGDVSRIENIVDTGTPDISGVYFKDYWIELKAVEDMYNKISSHSVLKYLEPSQVIWHARRVKHGSIIFVMVKYINAIVLEACIEPNVYEIYETIFKEKNRFDYMRLQSTLIYLIKEAPWCI